MNIRKKGLCIAAAVLCAVCSVSAVAPYNPLNISASAEYYEKEPHSYENLKYKRIDSDYKGTQYDPEYDYVLITGCDDSAVTINIPEEIDGLPVTKIDMSAFEDISSLENIIIPSSITEIGRDAFSGTKWLEKKQAENPLVTVNSILVDGTACSGDVIIPEDVTKIVSHAFEGNKKITGVTIPESVTEIAGSVFKGCSELKTVSLPNGLTVLQGSTFRDCSALESVNIPESVRNFGASVFYGCSSLKEITLPETVTSLGYMMFAKCTSLESIELPENVIIGDAVFSGCTNLENIIIPESITDIGSAVFDKTKWLSNRQAENPLVIVNNSVIDGSECTGNVVIPDNVVAICGDAFSNSEIETVTIPYSVSKIGSVAFINCKSLSEVRIMNPVCEITDDATTFTDDFYEDSSFTGTIYGYDKSTAQQYAEKYGRKFALLDEPLVTTTSASTAQTTVSSETSTTVTTVTTPQTTITGDANGDNKLDVRDAAYIARMLASGKSLPMSADFNGDGKVNVRDAAAIARHLASKK